MHMHNPLILELLAATVADDRRRAAARVAPVPVPAPASTLSRFDGRGPGHGQRAARLALLTLRRELGALLIRVGQRLASDPALLAPSGRG